MPSWNTIITGALAIGVFIVIAAVAYLIYKARLLIAAVYRAVRSGAGWTFRIVLTIFLVAMWVFPGILQAIAYYWAPALRQPITSAFDGSGLIFPEDVQSALFRVGALAFVWLALEIFTAIYRNTPTSVLILNTEVAILWTGVLGGYACIQYGAGNLLWWMVVAPAVSLIDLVLGVILCLNNAAQKPFAPTEKAPWWRHRRAQGL